VYRITTDAAVRFGDHRAEGSRVEQRSIETTRRYYHDSYVVAFESTVVEITALDGRPAAVLAETIFYPTSGGQPHDTGVLGSRRVENVVVRDSDGAIVHVLDGPVELGPVEGSIDWPRRFDHMQQHTGQHLLSQAFIRVAAANTIGFHLGAEYVSIDLDVADLDESRRTEAFAVANAAVERDLAIRAWFPTEMELATIALRKTPDVEGALRVVAIGDFDVSACGGTHVSRTGEVGLVHSLRSERLKRGTRVTFLCGDRARRDYAAKQRIVSQLSAQLTCAVDELPETVSRLQHELQTVRRELGRHHEEALDREALSLRASAGEDAPPIIVRQAWDGRPVEDLKGLALRLTSQPGVIALLGTGGQRTQLVLARSEELSHNLKPALDAALAEIGGGKGGGGRVVQGGGAGASLGQVERALGAAAAILRASG
jgi:alanyl-tRNA synthetase